ncbi:hypothetical protein FRX31_031012 [Thalictrum thalictroides]|uniref:Uncharacterized protein n=1 Tax=Thalictrum thalictroides TaxID=46969 RepID=A0A7J6V3N3_THATH|nr:hypothetical protein FRX31_031012 [Thalictrum thalictroides]
MKTMASSSSSQHLWFSFSDVEEEDVKNQQMGWAVKSSKREPISIEAHEPTNYWANGSDLVSVQIHKALSRYGTARDSKTAVLRTSFIINNTPLASLSLYR